MPSAKLIQKLKPALQNPLPPEQDGILLCLDSDGVTGDNAKYMNMYNRLARWYEFGERCIARLRYGNSINETRRSLMDELEWRQDCTALYVSIGTGTDYHDAGRFGSLTLSNATGKRVDFSGNSGAVGICHVPRRRLVARRPYP